MYILFSWFPLRWLAKDLPKEDEHHLITRLCVSQWIKHRHAVGCRWMFTATVTSYCGSTIISWPALRHWYDRNDKNKKKDKKPFRPHAHGVHTLCMYTKHSEETYPTKISLKLHRQNNNEVAAWEVMATWNEIPPITCTRLIYANPLTCSVCTLRDTREPVPPRDLISSS